MGQELTAAIAARAAAEADITALWPLAYGPVAPDATPDARIFRALAGLADTVARNIYAVRDAEVIAAMNPDHRWQAQRDIEAQSSAYGT